ncbi:MAG: hydrogenase maturation protease [Planctomycetota bacterium]
MSDALETSAPVLVLGLGNLLLHDDAVGLRLLAELRARHRDDPRIEFVDGGTQGIALLARLQGRRALLVLDAVQRGAPAGAVHRIDDALHTLPAGHGGAPGGAHQVNAGDLLLAARLVGDLPARVAVCGVEPAVVRTGIGLTPAVAAALPRALQFADELLGDLLSAEVEPCTN